MKQTNKPMIELYMYSLNQEFPVKKGHETFLKKFSETKVDASRSLVNHFQLETQVFNRSIPADWSVQWISNEWITNHTKAAGVGIRSDMDPMLNVYIRQEDFGAIMFEPLSDRVFKLNHEGHALLNDLIAFYKKGSKDLAKFETKQFNSEDVILFVEFLKGAGIWINQ